MSSALQRPRRGKAPILLLLGILGCGGRAVPGGAATPAPATAAEPPSASAVPSRALRVTLRAEAAELVLSGGERCVTVPEIALAEALGESAERAGPLEVCPEAPVRISPERLGAITFEGGWALPLETIPHPAHVELQLHPGEGIEPLGPAGSATAYLWPGPRTRVLREGLFVHHPTADLPDDAGARATAELRQRAFAEAARFAEATLGAPRQRVVVLDGALATETGPIVAAPAATRALGPILHAWLPGPPWWTHGMAAHLALVLERARDARSEADAWDELMTRYHRHRRTPGRSALDATGRLAEDLGALVSFCLDAELTRADRSLVAELREAGGPEELMAGVAHDAPELAHRHRKRLARRGVVDLDACLQLAGSRLVAHQVPIVDPARLLRVRALGGDEPAVAAAGTGPLREGDVIRHVRGLAIRHAWEIVFHLRELEGRHRFSVSVQRGDRTIRTWLRMVSLGDDLPTTVRFRAEPDEELEGDANPFAERVARRALQPSEARR